MSETVFGVNSPETNKVWSRKLSIETLKKTSVGKFIGDGPSSLIHKKKELQKTAGDRVRCTLRTLLEGDGVQGDEILEGKEESLSTYTDDFLINQVRHAADAGGRMSQQRVLFNMRSECRDGLSDWCAARIDRWFFTQICGYTGGRVTERGEVYDGTNSIFTGNNATLTPTANRQFFASDAATADQDLSSSHPMALSLLDDLKVEAELASPMLKPVMYQGEKLYVVFIDPRQERQLRAETGAGGWQNIQRALLEGGEGKKQNKIFQGGAGLYNNMIIHTTPRITQGVNGSSGAAIGTVRRAVLCGAQAAAIGFGKGDDFESWNWAEEPKDYNNKIGVAAGWIGGLKKTQFDGEDFGTMVLSTYAPAG